MATLEKIRNKAGVLIAAIIGLALLAFILGDLLDSRKSIFNKANNNVGEISGKKIDIQTFEQKVNSLLEIYKIRMGSTAVDDKTTEGMRDNAWQEIVTENTLGKEYEKLGLDVSSDELSDNMIGSSLHPVMRQAFGNPQTGEFNKSQVIQFLKYTNENPSTPQNTFRLYIEDYIKNDRLKNKYVNLIQKGLSVPTFIAKDDYAENNTKVDFNFIVQRYTNIPDNAVTISESDLSKYYKDHKYQYEQTASKDIQYVTFDILPSAEDHATAEEWIKKIKPDFVTTTEVEQFVNANSDVPYEDKVIKPSQLPDSISKFMFAANVGDVYGPYFDNGAFKLAKLYKVVVTPDSVKARHILIAPKGKTKEEADKAKSLADSIFNIVSKDKKADFAALAIKYSDDKGSGSKGGDLGWFAEGSMVKPFNDAAFELKKGDMKLVETQFGYHIIQVEDRSADSKKVKVGFVERKLSPSNQTYNMVYGKAMKFSSENRTYAAFKAASEKQNLSPKLANNISETDRSIPGLDQPRPLLKWIASGKKGDVSEPLQLGDRFVIAAVIEDRKKGTAPLDQVKSDVEVKVRKEKKIAKLTDEINKAKSGVSSIQDLSLKLNTPVETATGISFNSYSLPNYGIEPKVIAFASVFSKSKISQPVDGNNGMYVLYVTNIVAADLTNYKQSKQRLSYMFQQRASYDSYNALIKLADIKDLRTKFY